MSGHDVDAILSGVWDKIGLLEDTAGGLDRIRARASDDDDVVTAEVDGQGNLTGLWINDSIAQLDTRTVSELIIQTAAEAARLATEQRMELIRQLQEGFETP